MSLPSRFGWAPALVMLSQADSTWGSTSHQEAPPALSLALMFKQHSRSLVPTSAVPAHRGSVSRHQAGRPLGPGSGTSIPFACLGSSGFALCLRGHCAGAAPAARRGSPRIPAPSAVAAVPPLAAGLSLTTLGTSLSFPHPPLPFGSGCCLRRTPEGLATGQFLVSGCRFVRSGRGGCFSLDRFFILRCFSFCHCFAPGALRSSPAPSLVLAPSLV